MHVAVQMGEQVGLLLVHWSEHVWEEHRLDVNIDNYTDLSMVRVAMCSLPVVRIVSGAHGVAVHNELCFQ